MLYGKTQGDDSAVGVADDVDRADVQRSNEPGQVGNVGRLRELRALVRPGSHAEVALVDRNETVTLGDYLALRFPGSVVRDSSVHEDDRRSSALLDVLNVRPAHRHLLDRRVGNDVVLARLARRQHRGTTER